MKTRAHKELNAAIKRGGWRPHLSRREGSIFPFAWGGWVGTDTAAEEFRNLTWRLTANDLSKLSKPRQFQAMYMCQPAHKLTNNR